MVLREVTQGKGRVNQKVKEDERQEDAQVQMEKHPQLETEVAQQETPAEARQPPEEDPAEMEVQEQEDLTRTTEPRPTPGGQEGARTRKQVKHLGKSPESKEEGAGCRPSANSKGWAKKLGDKARSVMRTSPPMEGAQKRNSHPKSRQEEQHQSRLGLVKT